MKTCSSVSLLSDPRTRLWLCCIFVTASFIFAAFFLGTAVIAKDCKERILRWDVSHMNDAIKRKQSSTCKNQCRPSGSEALPKGIVARTSNMNMKPLWGSLAKNNNSKLPMNLLAMAVGVKQKEIVNRIVVKFLSSDFVVMLFHYDGAMDEWRNFEWNDQAIHVSAKNQTKWWFAKRFLHPDVVFEYNYIFLWDEDLGVENFNPGRYLSIVKDEGLEISQPALDLNSDVHHAITARVRGSRVHRRVYKLKGKQRCDGLSTAPPCIGWVEMMAPVFSKAAWQCAWYMIQNDLIHAWGLDMQLGYCAQGDRIKNVGVVDSEYVAHLGLSTLGALDRFKIRKLSYDEMKIFKQRWKNAVMEDECWVDPYKKSPK